MGKNPKNYDDFVQQANDRFSEFTNKANAEFEQFRNKANAEFSEFRADMDERHDRFSGKVQATDELSAARLAIENAGQKAKLNEVFNQYGFQKDNIKETNLEDGTRFYSDGRRMAISGKDGLYVAEGDAIIRVDVNAEQLFSGTALLNDTHFEELGKVLPKFIKGSERVSNISEAKRYSLKKAKENADKALKAQRDAEKSPEVAQIKKMALERGFDAETLKIQALEDGQVAVISKNGVAVGKGETFYFTPRSEDMHSLSLSALTEVRLNVVNGTEPMYMEIPFSREKARLITETYHTMSAAYNKGNSYDRAYASKLNSAFKRAYELTTTGKSSERGA